MHTYWLTATGYIAAVMYCCIRQGCKSESRLLVTQL